jgi:hypothetical protein
MLRAIDNIRAADPASHRGFRGTTDHDCDRSNGSTRKRRVLLHRVIVSIELAALGNAPQRAVVANDFNIELTASRSPTIIKARSRSGSTMTFSFQTSIRIFEGWTLRRNFISRSFKGHHGRKDERQWHEKTRSLNQPLTQYFHPVV